MMVRRRTSGLWRILVTILATLADADGSLPVLRVSGSSIPPAAPVVGVPETAPTFPGHVISRNGERGGGGDVQELTWTTNNVTQQGDSLEGFGPDLEVDRHSKLEQRKSPSISKIAKRSSGDTRVTSNQDVTTLALAIDNSSSVAIANINSNGNNVYVLINTPTNQYVQ